MTLGDQEVVPIFTESEKNMSKTLLLRGFGVGVLALLLTACGVLQQPERNRFEMLGESLDQAVTQLYPESPVPSAETGEMADETPELWFVELRSPPVADGGSRAEIAREQRDFRQAASRAPLRIEERFAYQDLFNGFSVRVEPAGIAGLARLPGVKAVYPVVTATVPETEPAVEPELATALAMTGADIAQSEGGLTGTGVRVAVMDTGIDYDHSDLGGCFGPGCRVATGHDFVGNDYTAGRTPVPDDDPDDCQGHGTHVAGIIGASGGSTGVAPGVTFGAYRVFGCTGSTTADIMLAAMERALADDMDVLNMSIGSAFQWPQYPTAVASDRLVNQGVVVVASIGNSGASGVYSAGAPGVGQKVIGVASVDNTHINALTFDVVPSGQKVPYLPLSTTPDAPMAGGSPEVAYVGRGCPGDDYLDDPDGKIALIVRGQCTFNLKYARAHEAGALGVVIHNNLTGLFAGGGVVDRGIFGIGISRDDGLHIRSALDGGGVVTLDWTDERVNAPNPTGNLVSGFSSYGLSPDLDLKPDIAAPGGLIRAPIPLEQGGYGIKSGTSMAAPHVAGAVALLLEAQPNTSAQAVRGLLQNSARPGLWWGNPGLGFLDNVHRQGAGVVNIPAAVASTTAVSPSKLALGESEAGTASVLLTIENDSADEVTYTISHQPALSTGRSTFAPSFFTGFASVAVDDSTIVVPAHGTADVAVRITANQFLPDGSQYGGYIVVSGDNGYLARVPYGGYKGDYQARGVLGSEAHSFPWLARLSAGTFRKQSDGASFTLGGDDVPFFLVHLDHQVRRLRMEVFEAGSGRSWNRASEFEYVGRNSTGTSFFAFPWDGVTTRGVNLAEVPDGDYVVRISVQKALGDDAAASHWESWTSPSFTVARD
jgi:minor extracellular serine protease Vpr